MKIKHREIEIPTENPFENCQLGREQYAQILTDIIKVYADGFVLAINNEWGTGKTTFVKMWQQHLENNNFKTIYFNAWENDFDSNPLVAIMSELKTLTNSKNKAVFKSAVEKGAVLAKNVLPALLKAVAKKYIDTEELVDAIENTTKGATEIFEEEIKDYTHKKKSIGDFRIELGKFVEKTENDNPLVFIIDELDRCRPHYAVEVLEQMKHFFSVPGIVFVLSIDKNHLASSVRGFYGSENINTDEYLRRFIDLEYSIPMPSNKAFCKYLYTYYSFGEFFSLPKRIMLREPKSDGEHFLKIAEILFDNIRATLRQQEKIFAQSRLILRCFGERNYTFSHLLFYLVFLKTLNNDLYRKIEGQSLTLQELSDAFADTIPSNIEKYQEVNLIYLQALLLQFYNNSHEHQAREKLFVKDNEGNEVISITSKLEKGIIPINLAICIKSIQMDLSYRYINLEYLLKKISLSEPLII